MKPLEGTDGRFAYILYGGVPFGRWYRTKFQARRAVVLHAINQGWSFRDCELAFLDATTPGSELWLTGADGRDLGQAEPWKRLSSDFKAMQAHASASPLYRSAVEARQRIGELAAEARTWPWKGRSGRTDRDVLSAIHDAATKVGTDSVDVSTRDIALQAGVTARTAATSLKRLEAAGWLSRAPAAWKRGHAVRYKLGSQPLQYYTHDSLGVVEVHVCRNATQHAGREIWVRLGKAAHALYQVLDVAPMTARELARRAGVCNSTASRRLPDLELHGLASKSHRGWSLGTTPPDDVAQAEGWVDAHSRVERRRREYDEDRVTFRAVYGIAA